MYLASMNSIFNNNNKIYKISTNLLEIKTEIIKVYKIGTISTIHITGIINT